MFPIHSLKDNLISASPFLVSLPFTINGASKFEVSEEQALYQPPGYVFGIVWPTLYILLFKSNNSTHGIDTNLIFMFSFSSFFIASKDKETSEPVAIKINSKSLFISLSYKIYPPFFTKFIELPSNCGKLCLDKHKHEGPVFLSRAIL